MMPTMCPNFGGDPVLRARRTIAVTRPLILRLLLRDHAQAAGVWKTDAVKWPYQPKHSPSYTAAGTSIHCVGSHCGMGSHCVGTR